MNYTTLVQNIKDFMEDDGTEFSAAIDTFIDITELKLSRELRIPAFRRRATSTLTANDPFISMPSDMVSLENLHLIESNSRTLLQLRSDEFMMEYWPDRTGQALLAITPILTTTRCTSHQLRQLTSLLRLATGVGFQPCHPKPDKLADRQRKRCTAVRVSC